MRSDGKYTIGLDFGSLSARGILADVRDGSILAEASCEYAHGVLDTFLPDETKLEENMCLQDIDDFTGALESIIVELVSKGGISSDRIVGIGIDTTASTILPVDENFIPLCKKSAFSSRPHAWMKMWKHHASAEQAERLTEVCRESNKTYLERYGGKISPECLTAKVTEVFEKDREVYEEAAAFIEVADYLTSLLAGKPVFSASIACAKAMYTMGKGYPDDAFFTAFNKELKNLPEKLMEHYPNRTLVFPGEKAGELSSEMAEKLGLRPGIAISAGQMDAYSPMLALGIAREAAMMMIVGTSTGIMLLSSEPKNVEGITACLPDTYYKGFWGYASGQASVGDGFGWFAKNCVPESYAVLAREKRMDLQRLLTEKASTLEPGESGVIALDWINGNKSRLANSRLSGMFLGINLTTKPEHLYRALLEATAFGARKIKEAYDEAGVPVTEIYVCGGIPGKNPLMMQIYADVLGLPIKVSRCTQAPALGSAVYAAAAAGAETGYRDVFEAVENMYDRVYICYTPDEKHREAYEKLYGEYVLLHDYFGRGGNSIMERLYGMRKK